MRSRSSSSSTAVATTYWYYYSSDQLVAVPCATFLSLFLSTYLSISSSVISNLSLSLTHTQRTTLISSLSVSFFTYFLILPTIQSCAVVSRVTSLGEISPLWQYFECIWQFLMVMRTLPKCEPMLGKFVRNWANFHG